jgi:hypothetical protein
MTSKRTKAPASGADDNLDELFEGIGDDAKSKKPTNTKPNKPTSAASKAKGNDDILADLESQLASEEPSSRPHTPRGVRRQAGTPPVGDDKPAAAGVRKSTDSARSLRASFTPSVTSSELHESDKKGPVEQVQSQQQQQQQSSGGWWGGIMSTATGVMKQAENAYKEIQQNEEAKKWADQVRGLSGGIDVGALRNYGKCRW